MTSPMPPSLPNGFANLSLNDRTVGEPFDVPLPFEEDFEVDEERGNNPYSDEEDSQDDENELRGARGTSYTIYHSQASKRFTVETLNQHVTSDDFDGEAALSLLQAKASIDFGDSRTPGPEYASRANQELFVFTPTYFLDYLSLIGLPLRAITPDHSHCLAGIKINVSFRHWAIPYAGKHNKQLGFTLQNRTFRIGSISSGETWFIVLHPRSILPDVYDNAKARKRTALLHHHAKQLSNYIISIFESSEIPGQRVEPSWKLNGSEDCDLELDVWGLFQKKFMENWSHFISDSNTPEVANDQFWQVNVPAFHAYQYGQNTPVNVTTEVENYPQEPVDPQIISDSLDTQHSDSEYDSDSDRESDRDERSNNGDGPASPIHTPSGSVRTAETSLRSLLSRLPPDDGVLKFTNYLQDRYKVENLHFVSYALAADIHCETGDNYGKCCLIDRKRLSHLFPTGRGFNPSFWPLALNQRYGNVTADKPPEFIQNHAYAVLKANLYQENGREILHDNYFQGYSKVQRHFRFNPDDLLADKGISTGALALPKSERGKRQKIRNIHDRLVKHILGPESGKPLAREKQRVTRAIAKRDFAFRLEQIVTIDVKALLPVNKHAETLIRPMLQLIRVFNLEQKYIKIFRVFEPSVFPGILCTFSRLFEVAIGYITDYFVQNKLEYVGVPAAEYVSLLDRVAAYMFTGSAKYLKPSVMRKLGTMDALKKFAFPYIDPGMLQVCPQTYLNIEKWPKDDRGRPNLLQTAALGYYYGKTVRSGRESSIYFEYFKNAIQAPAEAMEYLVDLLKEQMLPETSRFIGRQLLRAIGDDKNQNRAAKTNHRELVSTWENAENPFSKQVFSIIDIYSMQADKKLVKTYKIHAEEIFTACKNGSKALLRAQDSQWFPNFHNAIKASAISDANWIFQLTQAWKKLGVECLPGIDNHGCTTSKQMLQLTDISTRIAPESSQSNAMKQRAIEEAGPVKIEQRQKMDLGKLSEIDPQLFVEISKQQAASGLQSDSISHYEMMKDVLRENANDPKLHCCLILAKILGAASKSVTPTVKKNWTGSDGRQGKVEGTGYGLTPVVHLKVDRKNSSQDFYRVNTVLRFLWMAYPDSFSPLKIQEHSAMGITKMRQKIGHKGALPVVLAEVGLAIVRARWPKPRPEEVALHSDDALKQLRDQLWSLRKSPRELIEVVFGLDSDDQWLNRCAALLVDA